MCFCKGIIFILYMKLCKKKKLNFFITYLIFPSLFCPPGPDPPGEPHQVSHTALAAAAGEAVSGEAWLSGVELALPQPVLRARGHAARAGQQCPQQPYGPTDPEL